MERRGRGETSSGWTGPDPSAADPEGAIAQCRAENPTWPESEYGPWAQAKADVDETFLRAGIAMLGTPWREIAAAIEVPALVVTGDQEVILTARCSRRSPAVNPRFDVRVVDGAAHCVRRDRGDAFHARRRPVAGRAGGVRRRQPPATAGMMLIWVPSGVALPSPSRKRTSSLPT